MHGLRKVINVRDTDTPGTDCQALSMAEHEIYTITDAGAGNGKGLGAGAGDRPSQTSLSGWLLSSHVPRGDGNTL